MVKNLYNYFNVPKILCWLIPFYIALATIRPDIFRDYKDLFLIP